MNNKPDALFGDNSIKIIEKSALGCSNECNRGGDAFTPNEQYDESLNDDGSDSNVAGDGFEKLSLDTKIRWARSAKKMYDSLTNDDPLENPIEFEDYRLTQSMIFGCLLANIPFFENKFAAPFRIKNRIDYYQNDFLSEEINAIITMQLESYISNLDNLIEINSLTNNDKETLNKEMLNLLLPTIESLGMISKYEKGVKEIEEKNKTLNCMEKRNLYDKFNLVVSIIKDI